MTDLFDLSQKKTHVSSSFPEQEFLIQILAWYYLHQGMAAQAVKMIEQAQENMFQLMNNPEIYHLLLQLRPRSQKESMKFAQKCLDHNAAFQLKYLVAFLGVMAGQKQANAQSLSSTLLRYQCGLADIAGFQPFVVPKVLQKLQTGRESLLMKKSHLKRLQHRTPFCVATMKCLSQQYAIKAAKVEKSKQMSAEEKYTKLRKLAIKTLECLVVYFENAQNTQQLKDWEFFFLMLQNAQSKYSVILSEVLGPRRLKDWQQVYLG